MGEKEGRKNGWAEAEGKASDYIGLKSVCYLRKGRLEPVTSAPAKEPPIISLTQAVNEKETEAGGRGLSPMEKGKIEKHRYSGSVRDRP